jgi:hypothetical protein
MASRTDYDWLYSNVIEQVDKAVPLLTRIREVLYSNLSRDTVHHN